MVRRFTGAVTDHGPSFFLCVAMVVTEIWRESLQGFIYGGGFLTEMRFINSCTDWQCLFFCWLVVSDDRRDPKHHRVACNIVCKCKKICLTCSFRLISSVISYVCVIYVWLVCAGFFLFVHGPFARRIWRRCNFLCGLSPSALDLVKKFSPNINW
jgi:hypothetical protein